MIPNLPAYPDATREPPGFILQHLNQTYNAANVVWPTIVSVAATGQTVAYAYDRNGQNLINAQGDNRPNSRRGVPNAFLDYTANPRALPPGAPRELAQMINGRHRRIYDFMVDRNSNPGYTAADIDFVWSNGEQWRGMEFTTFFVEFANRAEAERVVSMMNRRPSWQGNEGPVAVRNIITAGADLGLNLVMVCVNTIGRASTQYRIGGNAYWFPLNMDQLRRLRNGQVPVNASFGTVQDMLNSL